MKPEQVKKSEQDLQMHMLCLDVTLDITLGDGGFTDPDTVYNMVEVLSDTVELSRISRYDPATNDYADDANFHNLGRGVYFGYFRDISVVEGRVRLVSW